VGPDSSSTNGGLGSLRRSTRRRHEPQFEPLPADARLDDVLRELLEHTTEILEADTAVILLREDGQTLLKQATALDGGLAEREENPWLTVADLTASDGLDTLLRARGVQSLLAVPMLRQEHFAGVLVIASLTPRSFRPDEARLLQLFADRAALELEHGGVLADHRRAWALQRSLLPERLPMIQGVTLAARYLPASPQAGVGGGWYDAIALRNGRVGVAVGDVAGRGSKAATLMGELRSALRAYALEDDGPTVVAAKLWHYVHAFEHGEMATLLYGVLDPADGTLRFASAAHPGPAIVHGDGSVEFVPAIPAAPLGVGSPPRGDETETALGEGATMLLFTEGLAEQRRGRLADRRSRLAAVAAHAPDDPESLCSHLISRLLDGRRPEDDVALLAAQAASVLDGVLTCTVRADASELSDVRRRLRRWLAAHGAGETEISAITLACQEACANAVEHAYGLDEATFDVAARHDEGDVEVTVRDTGHWRPPRGHNRGRGLGLMRHLVDQVDVEHDEDGTTVRLTRHLREAAAS
jgi:anti-sigma regulatory factor (Ser/Thr protein kinase)